jgi:hypothetical protein
MASVETRRIGKLEGISTMRRLGFPPPKSCKAEGKLLTPSKIIQIM